LQPPVVPPPTPPNPPTPGAPPLGVPPPPAGASGSHPLPAAFLTNPGWQMKSHWPLVHTPMELGGRSVHGSQPSSVQPTENAGKTQRPAQRFVPGSHASPLPPPLLGAPAELMPPPVPPLPATTPPTPPTPLKPPAPLAGVPSSIPPSRTKPSLVPMPLKSSVAQAMPTSKQGATNAPSRLKRRASHSASVTGFPRPPSIRLNRGSSPAIRIRSPPLENDSALREARQVAQEPREGGPGSTAFHAAGEPEAVLHGRTCNRGALAAHLASPGRPP
jgi:hypothetical protein